MGTNFTCITNVCRAEEQLTQIGFKPSKFFKMRSQFGLQKKETPTLYCQRIAERYAKKFLQNNILVVFNAVFIGRRLITQPKTEEEIYRILKLYSGRNHIVYSCIFFKTSTGKLLRKRTFTRVKVKPISLEEQKKYVASLQWQGNHGGYSADGIFNRFVIKTTGAPFGKIPYYEVANLLQNFCNFTISE